MDETAAYQRDDGIWVIPRSEFASRRFHYSPGQHVVFAGPTQRAGKTTLAFKLLEYTATQDLPAYVAVSKPADPVSSKEGARLKYRRVDDFPFRKRLKEYTSEGKPTGYLIWPNMSDPTYATQNAAEVTSRLMDGLYSAGARGQKCILVLDDTVTKSKVLGLDRQMMNILTMAGAMGVGAWTFVQKPTGAGDTALWSFSQSEHVFISRDPDKRNRERYREIGGLDINQVDNISQSLKPYQFLYLERTHGHMCIVDSK